MSKHWIVWRHYTRQNTESYCVINIHVKTPTYCQFASVLEHVLYTALQYYYHKHHNTLYNVIQKQNAAWLSLWTSQHWIIVHIWSVWHWVIFLIQNTEACFHKKIKTLIAIIHIRSSAQLIVVTWTNPVCYIAACIAWFTIRILPYALRHQC